ncbi:MAG: beta-glucosidase BglX [Prolixibacteraceae bacterium]|nr:beta-glucosidase BglX [Prolixibacteraceae bacterium]
MMKMMKMVIVSLLIGIVLGSCTNTSQKTTDPIEEKVQTLIGQMTFEEKLGQLVQTNYHGEPEDWKEQLAEGKIGSFLNLSSVEYANEVQRIVVEESRLGIPLLVGRDVIHGFNTVFPIPLGMASSWSPELAEGAMKIAAREASANGINWTFAPMIDVSWDPRWGRIAETCGEDPYLTSVLGAAMVKGYQGTDPSEEGRIAACAKHFVGYGMSEAGRDYNTTYIPEALLRNVHLRPFKAAADAGCLTFMSAFNDLNGVPTSGNYFTLRTILRDEWKYDGMVVSDWASIQQQIVHGYTETETDAAEKSIKAGVDMEMASRCYDNLPALLEAGKIDVALINESVANILRIKFKLGLFNNPYTDVTLKDKVILTDENLDYARKVARGSMVLLKNEKQTLPLNKTSKVALIGPMTNAPHDQMGTWVFDGDEKNSITPLTSFTDVLGKNLNYAIGLEYSRDKSKAGFAKAIAAAKKSDVIVLLVGEESGLSGEANSRAIIDLPGIQSELLRELNQLNKPLVLVVMAGRPLGIGADIELADAVLYAWHPGTMAGPALTDLIFGDYSPSGKLPITFVKGAGQIPFYYYRKNTGKPTDPERMTYIDDIPRNSKQLSLGFTSMHIDYGITPLYPFGYGMTYTTFEYGDVKLSSKELTKNGELKATCTLTNTGNTKAEEIVQLYVRDLFGSLTRPIKELKGFQKVELAPGESKELTFTITAKDLEFYNGEEYLTEAGDFNLWIAKDSDSGEFVSFAFVNE